MHNDDATIINSCDNFIKPTVYIYNDKQDSKRKVELCNSGASTIAYDEIMFDITQQDKLTSILLIKDENSNSEFYCPMCNAVHHLNEWIDAGQDTSETTCIICGAESSMNVSRNKIEYVCSNNEAHNIIIGD